MRGLGRAVHERLGAGVRGAVHGNSGLGIVEVMASTVVVGIAVVGIALMFGKGSAWVAASGDDRVAAGLAQQRIEGILAMGWGGLIPPGEAIRGQGYANRPASSPRPGHPCG